MTSAVSKAAKTSAVSVDRGDDASADESRKRKGLGVTCGVKAPCCTAANLECDGVVSPGRAVSLEGVLLAEIAEGKLAELSSHGSFLCTLVAGVARASNLTALRGVSGTLRISASSWPDSDQGKESWSSASSKPVSESGRFKALLG